MSLGPGGEECNEKQKGNGVKIEREKKKTVWEGRAGLGRRGKKKRQAGSDSLSCVCNNIWCCLVHLIVTDTLAGFDNGPSVQMTVMMMRRRRRRRRAFVTTPALSAQVGG